jgi:hypothetical protein
MKAHKVFLVAGFKTASLVPMPELFWFFLRLQHQTSRECRSLHPKSDGYCFSIPLEFLATVLGFEPTNLYVGTNPSYLSAEAGFFFRRRSILLRRRVFLIRELENIHKI